MAPNTDAKKPAAFFVVLSVDGEIIADFILAELKMSGREIHLSFIFSAHHTEMCKFVRAKLRESFFPAAASHSRPRQAGA